ncbi:RlpA-like double-psi beta-barrel domain [Plasmopara halstedii]|uniref:RlpA-like double-psi beta-barrel domain n=1 Tax=Plasmopara halstedii TaxID=4781 RepID=A0A0P1B0N3_PLAHL|nr:RlpA-like double-psi beta-barrel domain [Plasmopara halstedii]CEG47468.1 RlpA-like double-psi beta-barrel domain [Plasmopara halstedii]|eukprot:XP_024583837.1 RlpA-like double-psi beta-barrel domain [Plasmopara halstedii]
MYQGFGTVYTLTSPFNGNCNFMHSPDEAGTKYAALNAEQWEETMNCGRCVEVSCTDPTCADRPSEVVHILDQCPGCGYGGLDLSPEVFEKITGQTYTILPIEWKFVDCPVSSNVEYCLKTGSTEFWVAVQPTNLDSGVTSMKIDNQETSRVDSAFYFLIDGKGKSVANLSALSISLTNVNGEVLEDTLSMKADLCTAGSSQFSPSGDIYQTTTISEEASQEPNSTACADTTIFGCSAVSGISCTKLIFSFLLPLNGALGCWF